NSGGTSFRATPGPASASREPPPAPAARPAPVGASLARPFPVPPSVAAGGAGCAGSAPPSDLGAAVAAGARGGAPARAARGGRRGRGQRRDLDGARLVRNRRGHRRGRARTPCLLLSRMRGALRTRRRWLGARAATLVARDGARGQIDEERLGLAKARGEEQDGGERTDVDRQGATDGQEAAPKTTEVRSSQARMPASSAAAA